MFDYSRYKKKSEKIEKNEKTEVKSISNFESRDKIIRTEPSKRENCQIASIIKEKKFEPVLS